MKKSFNIIFCLTALLGMSVILSSCSTSKNSHSSSSAMRAQMSGNGIANKGKYVKTPLRPNDNKCVIYSGSTDYSMAAGKTIKPVSAKNKPAQVFYNVNNKHRKYMGQDKKARRNTSWQYIIPTRAKTLGQE